MSGLLLPPEELKALAKAMKTACGTGGKAGEGTVELQGDHRDAARAGMDFARRCLEVGAGDCDVVGVPARLDGLEQLEIGWIGHVYYVRARDGVHDHAPQWRR